MAEGPPPDLRLKIIHVFLDDKQIDLQSSQICPKVPELARVFDELSAGEEAKRPITIFVKSDPAIVLMLVNAVLFEKYPFVHTDIKGCTFVDGTDTSAAEGLHQLYLKYYLFINLARRLGAHEVAQKARNILQNKETLGGEMAKKPDWLDLVLYADDAWVEEHAGTLGKDRSLGGSLLLSDFFSLTPR